MNGLSLRRDILVVRDQDRMILRGDDLTIRFQLPVGVAELQTTYDDPFGFSGSHRDELDSILNDQRWLAYPMEPLPQGAIPLASILTSLTGDGNLEIPRMVVTSSEALVFPTNYRQSDFRRTLRFFVSRIDWFRLSCYASLLFRPRTEYQVWGDEPESQVIRDLLLDVKERELETPVVYRLSGRTWERISQYSPGSIPKSSSPKGRIGDRMSVVEMDASNVDAILQWPKSTLWMATGQFALPNLRFAAQPSHAKSVPRWCIGVDMNCETAKLKAVAEGVERFALGNFSVNEMIRTSANLLDGPWLHPKEIAAYSGAQRLRRGLSLFDPNEPEWWVQGDGPAGRIWIPAALVFCPFTGDESWLAPGFSSSNGSAAHLSVDEVRKKAFLELVERDAFMRTYLSGQPPKAIRTDSLSDQTRILDDSIRGECDDSGTFVMKSTLGITVVGHAAWLNGRVCIGASADSNLDSAAQKAMAEVLVQLRFPFEKSELDSVQVQTPEDHARLYTNAAISQSIHWIIEGDRINDVSPTPSKAIADAQKGAYFFVKAIGEWYVCRCLDPRIIHLTFGYDNELLDHPAVKSAMRDNCSLTDPLFPHPFA